MEYLASFEAAAFSTWMRESGLAFFGALILHAIGMGFIVGVHAATDLRVLGVAPRVPLSMMARFRPVGRAALVVVTLSGVLLLVAYPTKALTNPVFYAKLLAAGAALLAGRSLARGVLSDDAHDTGPAPARARRLAALSLALWVTVITTGRFLAYTYHVLMAADALSLR
jgi:hypothetical protein